MNYKHIPVINKTIISGVVLCLLFLLAACRANGATWERVQDTGILRVGLDPTYPPFENADGGELIGFDVDLARALAEEMGIKAEFVYFGYDGLYDALTTQQVDVLISALVIQPERTRDFAYSAPYFDAGQRLVVPAGSSMESREDLSGRSVAVELGAEGHVQATELARRLPDLEIIPYNTPAEALAAVAEGAASAAIVDNISALMHARNGLEIVADPVTVEPFALVVRIEDEQLLREFNRALARIMENGRLDDIQRDWFAG